MMYSISDLKFKETSAAGGCQGKLLRDGKVVGTFRDEGEGNGICTDYFIDKAEEDMFRGFITSQPDVITDLRHPTDPKKVFTYAMNADTFVSLLIDELFKVGPPKTWWGKKKKGSVVDDKW